MSRIDSKPYNEAQIQNIRRMLDNADKNGQPLFFEFKVDCMVFIAHANRLSDFDTYKDFIYHGAEDIEFSIFSSNPNDKNRKSFNYYLKEQKQELNGLDVKAQVEEQMERYKTQMLLEQLQKQIQEKDNTILQQDEWISEIQTKLKELQANPNHFGKIDLPKFFGSMLEGFVKRNPKVLNKVPGLEGIAEALTETDSKVAPPQQDRKVSFEVSEEGNQNPELSEDDLFFVALGNRLTKALTQNQLDVLIEVNEAFVLEPNKLQTVAELLEIKITPNN
jgi:hypothetical protein